MPCNKLLVATLNPGKVREIQQFMTGLSLEVLGLDSLPKVDPCIEDGMTFEANATIKAVYYSQFTPTLTMADDSGLVVDALGGEPGVHSARYLTCSATDEERYRAILEHLHQMPELQRTARFICCIALASQKRLLATFHGTVEGLINHAPRGQNGFGYDPIFLIPDLGKTMAELEPAEKLSISHRGRALRKMAEGLLKLNIL
jgi:XTP/dITP diphosphohydrolase